MLHAAAPFLGLILALAAQDGPPETVLPAGKARLREAGGPLQGGGWNLWSDGALGDWFEAAAAGEVEICALAAGTSAAGVWPQARWVLETEAASKPLGPPFAVDAPDFRAYRARVEVPRGLFSLRIEFLNDGQAPGEDRNLLVRELRIRGAAPAAAAPDPAERAARRNREVLREADARIETLRKGTLTVKAPPGTAVKVTQLRHEFPFGTAVAHQIWSERTAPDVRERYLAILKENFNHAVHENAMKWYHTQRKPGEPDWRDSDRVLDWCAGNGLTMRGHCVYWGVEKFVNPWLKELDDAALRAALRARGREVTSRHRGRIAEYDLNNEMIHGDWYAARLGEGVTKEMFEWAREGDPGAVLYVNDYNVLSGNDGPRYAAHIRSLLARGVPVGGIGCQGHFGRAVDARHVRDTLDDLARFKLPIKITEYDIDVRDEGVKAASLEALYKTCFAHPAVEGILMWGFWEGAHWRPAAALWRRDFTPTPAADTYRRLLFKEWWTSAEGRTDASGRFTLRAFYGRHAVEAGGARTEVELRKAAGAAEVEIR